MKGLCLKSTKDGGSFYFESEKPLEGRYYYLEDATTGTTAQRKTREKLIKIYWKSGLHPKYGGDQYNEFRDKLKRDLGEGFEKFIYVDMVYNDNPDSNVITHPKIFEVSKKEDIPGRVMNNTDMADMIRGKLKSLANYTKKQNMKFIDNLILDMTAAGVDSKEFIEMLEGIHK